MTPEKIEELYQGLRRDQKWFFFLIGFGIGTIFATLLAMGFAVLLEVN